MTARDAPPGNTSEAQSEGRSRFDWRAVFAILAIAIALTVVAAGVRLVARGFERHAQRTGERGLCYTYLDLYGVGSGSAVGALSPCAWPVLVVAGLGLAAFGVLSTRKQASSRVRRLSWAGLIFALVSALVYSVIFGLWFLGNLLCNYSNFLSPP
jgi:hypothetical protein